MVEVNNLQVSNEVLEQLYQEFVQFLKIVANEDFVSFQKSNYVDFEENYKYSIYEKARQNLRSKNWQPEDIGTGKIQKAVRAAMVVRVKHSSRNVDNNLINWRKINEFSGLETDKKLEELFFNFYKNKITPERAFEGLAGYFDYQLIAYLFFVNNADQFLPISQKTFDKVISEKLLIDGFKTTREKSWDNYKTFVDLIKQTHRFLLTKDKEARLLDAHTFLWILGKQREDWLKTISSEDEDLDQSNTETIIGVEEVEAEVDSESSLIETSDEQKTKQVTPTDIVWIKNITNEIVGRAYMDFPDDEFVLHFPTHHRGNVLSAQVGEIILLRQKIDEVPVFTHLVIPLDNVLIEDNERPDFRFGRKVKIIARTPLNDLIKVAETVWANINFGGISQGNTCKIENIGGVNELISELQLDVWERFSPFFSNDYKQSLETTAVLIKEVEYENPELSVTEGKLKLVSHFRRERNSEIVKRKKQRAIECNTLYCEVCGFSFREKYDVDFIECHHKTPISQTGVTKTKLEDLSLVCANCHRMLHKKIDGDFLSIEELKNRINHVPDNLTDL